jgi:hypothetical protein
MNMRWPEAIAISVIAVCIAGCAIASMFLVPEIWIWQ